jgi:hypothetical protein
LNKKRQKNKAASDIEKARFCTNFFVGLKTMLNIVGSKLEPEPEPEPQQIITVPQDCSKERKRKV